MSYLYSVLVTQQLTHDTSDLFNGIYESKPTSLGEAKWLFREFKKDSHSCSVDFLQSVDDAITKMGHILIVALIELNSDGCIVDYLEEFICYNNSRIRPN